MINATRRLSIWKDYLEAGSHTLLAGELECCISL